MGSGLRLRRVSRRLLGRQGSPLTESCKVLQDRIRWRLGEEMNQAFIFLSRPWEGPVRRRLCGPETRPAVSGCTPTAFGCVVTPKGSGLCRRWCGLIPSPVPSAAVCVYIAPRTLRFLCACSTPLLRWKLCRNLFLNRHTQKSSCRGFRSLKGGQSLLSAPPEPGPP